MLAFTAPRSPPFFVVKTGLAIPAGERLTLGRQASLIVPRLYLSNLFTARDRTQLAELGITHVLSAMEEAPNLPQDLGLKTLHVPIRDEVGVDILAYLDETTAWIKAALEENETNKVLVHCLVGMSRSATVVCAYILATTNMTPSETIDFVVSRRCVVCPNVGFRKQLEHYYMRLHPDAKSPARPTTPKSQGKFGMNLGKLRLWRTSVPAASSKAAQASTSINLQSRNSEESPKIVNATLSVTSDEMPVAELLKRG
ncbi:phosphatases II [Daedalea quercina L-15889]|uniref:Phosphatases II n=1 Tax=Daedalea quercina L-15889 TaxID=1314783 RepID=A0A165NTR8_9APHY|nr:phosphatases II [Daedalea quercina L-15889]